MEAAYIVDINMLNNIMNGEVEDYLAIFNHHNWQSYIMGSWWDVQWDYQLQFNHHLNIYMQLFVQNKTCWSKTKIQMLIYMRCSTTTSTRLHYSSTIFESPPSDRSPLRIDRCHGKVTLVDFHLRQPWLDTPKRGHETGPLWTATKTSMARKIEQNMEVS